MLTVHGIARQQRPAFSAILRRASTIPVPDFIRAKELGKRVKQGTTAIAKAFCVRENRKFYFEHAGEVYKFNKAKDIVLPHAAVARWMQDGKCRGKTAALELLEPDLLASPASLNTEDDKGNARPYTRNPVIALMGHINHGKTSLLDALSGGNVAEREAEKITQTINVREAAITSTTNATLLDTPGHFHFHRMRNNAADFADLVLLLVSLEEGCCLQTRESIGAIEELNLPVVVCLNKADIAADNVDDVIADLREYRALEEAPMLPISALERSSLVPLLDCLDQIIHSPAVQLESPAFPTVPIPRGIVLEIRDVRGAGLVYRVLIQRGCIRCGDHFVCMFTAGKIKKMTNMHGDAIKTGVPGQALDLLVKKASGEKDLPLEMEFYILKQKHAEQLVELRTASRDFASSRMEAENSTGNARETNLTAAQLRREEHDDNEAAAKPAIIKAASAGALATILDALEGRPGLLIVRAGVGDVTPGDVAQAGDEVPIHCFQVGMAQRLARKAAAEGVQIQKHATVHGLIAHVESYLDESTVCRERERDDKQQS